MPTRKEPAETPSTALGRAVSHFARAGPLKESVVSNTAMAPSILMLQAVSQASLASTHAFAPELDRDLFWKKRAPPAASAAAHSECSTNSSSAAAAFATPQGAHELRLILQPTFAAHRVEGQQGARRADSFRRHVRPGVVHCALVCGQAHQGAWR